MWLFKKDQNARAWNFGIMVLYSLCWTFAYICLFFVSCCVLCNTGVVQWTQRPQNEYADLCRPYVLSAVEAYGGGQDPLACARPYSEPYASAYGGAFPGRWSAFRWNGARLHDFTRYVYKMMYMPMGKRGRFVTCFRCSCMYKVWYVLLLSLV